MAGEQDNGTDSHGSEGILVAGRYRLLERLGAGGMGRVWKAYDESLDCEVAVKEVWLPPMLSDTERAERLARAQREARNAARMRNHPHIVSVHDMVSDQGMPWIVMDLIPSHDLLQTVERHGPLPQEQVAKIGLGVLDALTASHAAGILHRDVKPANVLLTTDGRVLLTDFGIAVQESDLNMTASGVLVGSPEFVAPERARGEASNGASDLFSLGATLYFAAEGRSPFSRETAVGVLTAVLFEETAPIARIPALAPLINGLLTKDPAARWDAARVRPELERLSGATSSGTPNPFVPPTMVAGTNGDSSTPAGGGPGAGTPYPGPVSTAPPTMAANAVGPAGNMGGGPTPYPPQGMPFGPNGPMGPGPGPGFHTTPMPAPKNNTGRNVGLGIGALLVVGGVVAAIALSGGGGSKNQNANTPVGNTSSVSTSGSGAPSAPKSSAPASGSATATGPTTSPSTSAPSSTGNSTDPATWDLSTTDQTPFNPDALLPVTFTDSKGVVYNATNRWTDTCLNKNESSYLQGVLTKYKCTNQAIGTYTDSAGRVLVDIAVLPLPDTPTAKNAFTDIDTKQAYTLDDWGIWCPSTGPGADICAQHKSTTNAQEYGYVQPDHRYLVHAVAFYVNLTSDQSARAWLDAAATSAAKLGGPQVANQ
ncbi:serine/threonine protein kinase [Catenulispora sp. NL8]|uniref:non-specific serine/threonine protein kinase n=1 Tax=Catenulispora pinistramenti TaxID=2705254 RepID=A0ABS5L1X4_9ACTN|nr:serine/threonine-protein kinase [Catenulispora pinistramenti]MBS2552179.1 serine/threonine protein kinase [Catenulispora pinistramenti]